MAEEPREDRNNGENRSPSLTVVTSDIIKKLHDVAIGFAQHENPAIRLENSAFDEKTGAFKTGGQFMILMTKKDENAEMPEKEAFVKYAQTYVKYFVGEEMASRVTEKSLCEIYSPKDQKAAHVGQNGEKEGSDGEKKPEEQPQQQTQTQGQQGNVAEELADILLEDVISPSYTGVWGYSISYSVNMHGRGSTHFSDSVAGRKAGLFGAIMSDLQNIKIKTPSGDTVQIGKIFDPDEWKKALGIPDIDANNIDSDIKRVLNHDYPNNTAQCTVFKANAVNNLLSKQGRLTTMIQKFISQSELCIVIKVYHSDHNYPDYSEKTMAEVFNKAAGAYYKNFRLTNRDYISEKNVLRIKNATDNIDDKDKMKRTYGTPVSGRTNPSSGTGTSESLDTFMITGEILESLFGSDILVEDDQPMEQPQETPDVEAPTDNKDDGGEENQEPQADENAMAGYAEESLKRLGDKEFRDRNIEARVRETGQLLDELKEMGFDDPATEKWMNGYKDKAFLHRPFALMDLGQKTLGESVVLEADSPKDGEGAGDKNRETEQTKRLDRLARLIASPYSRDIISRLKDDRSFSETMAKKFQAAKNENGETFKEKLVSYLSRKDAPTLVKTGFRGIDPATIDMLNDRLGDFYREVSEAKRSEGLEEILKGLNLTSDSKQNERISNDIRKTAKEDADRRKKAEKVLQDSAYDVMNKFDLKDDNDRFVFGSSKVERKRPETTSEAIDSLLFEAVSATDKIANINGAMIKRALDLEDIGCKSQKNMRNLNPIHNLFAYAPRDRVIQYLTAHGFCSEADLSELAGENLFVCIVKRGDGEHNGSFGEPAFKDDTVRDMFEKSLERPLSGFKALPDFHPTLEQIRPKSGELFTKALGFNSVRYPFGGTGANSPVNENGLVMEGSPSYPIPVLNAWVASGEPGDDDSLYTWLYFMFWLRGTEEPGQDPSSVASDLYFIPRKNLTYKNDREIRKDMKDGNYAKIRDNNSPYTP